MAHEEDSEKGIDMQEALRVHTSFTGAAVPTKIRNLIAQVSKSHCRELALVEKTSSGGHIALRDSKTKLLL